MLNLIFCVVFTVYCLVITYLKFTFGRCSSNSQLHGKTAIVTGASSGIGYETALDLARRGARVILACRSKQRTLPKVDAIKEATKNDDVRFMQLDLSSLASVRSFVKEFLRTETQLHMLVNNAGIHGGETSLTEDGLEVHYATNHLGPFMLTNLLLDILQTSAPSHIVNVTSPIYTSADVDFASRETFTTKEADIGFKCANLTYANTKLANIWFTRELARRLKDTGVTVNAVDPGMTYTNIIRHCTYPLWVVFSVVAYLFFKTSEEGAQTSIYLCVSDDVSDVSGQYYSECRMKPLDSKFMDKTRESALWDVSANVTGLTAVE